MKVRCGHNTYLFSSQFVGPGNDDNIDLPVTNSIVKRSEVCMSFDKATSSHDICLAISATLLLPNINV